MKQQEVGSRSIALPLTISIIAISFSAIFVKWSDAPASILSMYRMWFASILMVPIVWKKRSEFKNIMKKDWFFLFFSGFFLALHFVLVVRVVEINNGCKLNHHPCLTADCLVARGIFLI